MSDLARVPDELIRGFAAVWVTLAGGSIEERECAAGRLMIWRSDGGEAVALPDRMYGLMDPTQASVGPGDLPNGLLVHLPPGVSTPDAEPHCLGHSLRATSVEEAWASLRRVGRQGVDKARRMGCRVDAITDEEYFGLASIKAEALGGRAPASGLPAALRDTFGPAQVHLTGVRHEGVPVAAVLAVSVGGFGMLIDGASNREHWDKNPNNLAVWQAVSALVTSGCECVDYGFSPVGAGDARFKDHMGGRAEPLYRVRGA
jgi:hypothetical protein